MVNDTLLLGVNGSIALQTAIYPSNVTNDTVKLTGSNSEILRIDSLPEGVYIHALREGTATVYAVAADESREKDSCIVKVVSVPSTGIRLNKDTLRMYEENVDSLIATVLPLNATDKTVIWRLTDVNGGNINVGEFIDIISSSADNDSVYKFKALKADTLIIFAFAEDVDRGLKDSCVVIMKEQFVYVESDTVSVDGRIKMSLKIPDEVTFRGSFELQLPKGFGLTLEGSGYKTELADSYKESSGLNITARDDSTYLFEISPKTASASSKLRTASDKKEALNIYYTIYDNALENSTATYDARFVDIDFLFDNETEIKEKQLDIKIKVFKDPTGNEPVEEEKIIAYAKNHRLYVNTAKAETVYVYSSNGSLVFVKNKAEGLTMFELAAEDKILFVKGSSGWAQKVVTR
jgi:outer membrane lipoprotein-sorting protein